MPSPIVTIDLIKTALRHIGAISTGQTPSAEDTADALRGLNDVLERWSVERLAVFGNLPDQLAVTAGKFTYTVGPGGDWNLDRPVSIDSLYTRVQGMDYQVLEWSLADYNAIGIKAQRQQIVERFVFINDAPLARVILWPTPAEAVSVFVDAPRLLTQIDNPATILNLPPGYASALQYALAEELAPQYGSPIDVSSRARAAKALIKRANRTSQTARFDSSLAPASATGASIYGW